MPSGTGGTAGEHKYASRSMRRNLDSLQPKNAHLCKGKRLRKAAPPVSVFRNTVVHMAWGRNLVGTNQPGGKLFRLGETVFARNQSQGIHLDGDLGGTNGEGQSLDCRGIIHPFPEAGGTAL